MRFPGGLPGLLFFGSLCLGASAQARPAEDELAGALASLIQREGPYHSYGDWRTIESARPIRWQALPPTMLDESLPDGSYFERRGSAAIGGRRIEVRATGARTMVGNVYFVHRGAAFGEAAILAALQRRGFVFELARCPLGDVRAGGDRWWTIKAPGRQSAVLQTGTRCDGATCEAFALLLGDRLPSLAPRERQHYTDRCTGVDAGAPMPARAAWDEQLASMFAGLLDAPGVAAPAWSALDPLADTRWTSPGPQRQGPATLADRERYVRSGEVDLGGRVLDLAASGDATSVRVLRAEDQATRGDSGDVVAALRRAGHAVTLARCDRVYLLSSGHWYRIASGTGRQAALRRRVRCDTVACPKAQESYLLALDGELPPREPGEVEAVDGRCPGR
ncbi:MAG: hypothetical protein R3E41_02880 [Burkholderiaceae bacterium]